MAESQVAKVKMHELTSAQDSSLYFCTTQGDSHGLLVRDEAAFELFQQGQKDVASVFLERRKACGGDPVRHGNRILF